MGSPSPVRSPRFLNNIGEVQSQAVETRNDSPAASRPVPMVASETTNHGDVEANWSGDDAHQGPRYIPGGRRSELNSSMGNLSSTVSTVIWRSFEAVRNSTGFQRRPPLEDADRDR